jgi:hypothetical protein
MFDSLGLILLQDILPSLYPRIIYTEANINIMIYVRRIYGPFGSDICNLLNTLQS